MNTTDVRKYVTGLLKKWLPNKITLDKLSTSENGNLLFDGNEIKGGGSDITISKEDNNAIQTKDDGIFVDDKTEDIKKIDERFDTVYTKEASDKVLKEAIGQFIIDKSEGAGETVQTVSNETPVGTIIAHMGNTPPEHYLICDGTEYNIQDYQELTNFFEKEFGKINYFGGDGITTFKVPDLRGEFLRGTGTNSHEDGGNGSGVGVHQGGTQIPNVYTWNNSATQGNIAIELGTTTASTAGNIFSSPDKVWSTTRTYRNTALLTNYTSTSPNPYKYTARPTNTSVLYCIKYESTYYMSVVHNDAYISEYYENYSIDETIIGRWIDGKPIYRRVFEGTISASDWTAPGSGQTRYLFSRYITDEGYVDKLVSSYGYYINSDGNEYDANSPQNGVNMETLISKYIRTISGQIRLTVAALSNQKDKFVKYIITCEYTKTTDEPNSFTPDMITNQYTLGELDDTITEADINDIFN